MQFVINELPLLLLCPIGLIYAGMDGLPLTHLILALTLILSLILLYRFIYLKRMTYSVGNEQFCLNMAYSIVRWTIWSCTASLTLTNTRPLSSNYAD